MKFIKFYSYLTLILNITCQCSKIKIRKEIHNATPEERERFFNAFKVFMQKTGKDGIAHFSKIHHSNSKAIHGNSLFLPWHRKLITMVEDILISIDPNVIFLYWDWTKDSQAPEKSIVFENQNICGNGQGADKCIKGCRFEMQLTYPKPHCLRRNFKGGSKLSSFSSRQSIEMILSRNSDYSGFSKAIESTPHATPHTQMGGSGSGQGDVSTMYSTNDPAFFLHHGFLDLLWAEWQARMGAKGLTYNGGSAKTSDSLIGLSGTVNDVLDTKSKSLCYEYPRWGGNLPKSTNSIKTMSRHRSVTKSKTTTNLNFSIRRYKRTYISIKAAKVHDTALAILNGTIQGYQVDGNDRTQTHVLRTPEQIDEDWITMNGLDVEEFREEEELQDAINQALNLMNDYDPTDGINDIWGPNIGVVGEHEVLTEDQIRQNYLNEFYNGNW